ncbi:MAG: carbohydrate ABC transporter permease [Anaerolineae bacterium]|nr:carbohydrate ABC transporter permease [Anaerolineae bacterium]
MVTKASDPAAAHSLDFSVIAARASRRRRQQLRLVRDASLYMVMSAGSIAFVMPFVWMLSTSLKAAEQVWQQPPVWIPSPVVFQNYVDAVTSVPTLTYLKNSVLIAALSIVGLVFSSSLVAFAFSRIEWPGRDAWFGILLSTMMLPSQVTMIPVFVLFFRLGWVNTLKPLIVPSFFGSAFYIFLLRQFFMGIPRELDESAIIDGANPLVIWGRIILPLSGPALAAVAIFSFVGNWNDFMGPLIYLNRTDKWTLPLGLLAFRNKYGTEWAQLMAYSTLVMLPCLLVFFFFQRYFIQGITLTGIKG